MVNLALISFKCFFKRNEYNCDEAESLLKRIVEKTHVPNPETIKKKFLYEYTNIKFSLFSFKFIQKPRESRESL